MRRILRKIGNLCSTSAVAETLPFSDWYLVGMGGREKDGHRPYPGTDELPRRWREYSQLSTERLMSNTKQDRSCVAGGQDHEVEYEAKKTGSSKDDVKKAVKSAGNSRQAVEKKLKD